MTIIYQTEPAKEHGNFLFFDFFAKYLFPRSLKISKQNSRDMVILFLKFVNVIKCWLS